MADDTVKADFFQKILKVAMEILKPATDLFEDDAAKEELLGSLGLDPSVNVGSLPSTTNLDRYIAAEAAEVDEFVLLGAMHDFVQVTLAVEGMVRVAIDAEDATESHALDEILSAFLNVLLMEWVRRRSPEVHALGRLMATVNENAARAGGSIGFGRMVKEFFAPVFEDGLDTPAGARGTSSLLFALLGVSFYLVDRFVLKKNEIDNIEFRLGYGYEGISESSTPVADEIADRAISLSVTARPFDDPDNQGTAFTTLSLVPREHGGAAAVVELSGEIDSTMPVGEDKSFKIDLGGDGIFRIGEGASASAGPANRFKVTFKHKVDEPGAVRLMQTPEIRIGLKEYSFAVTITPDDLDIKLGSKFPFLLKRKKDAGFPQNLMPEEIKEDIPLDFGYSLKNDFYFGEGGGNPGGTADTAAAAAPGGEPGFLEKLAAKILNKIDIRAAIHKDIGGVFGLQVLNIKAGVAGNFDVTSLETSIDFWVKFGSPLTISISRLGGELQFTKREDSGGFLGTDVGGKFKPPTGAGIAVRTGVVNGGGFLYFDEPRGEYFGAVELEVAELFALKAIGLINTRFPDDSKGFSLLVLVTAEFTPISLAFGFTLDGVGGLLGYNRTIEVEAIRVGVRTNAIRSILFPEDVVGNISRIVSDIRDFFPPKEGQFVIGLMAKIGYAGTNLATIELGVLVELPDPKILIVGVVRVVAPEEDLEALKLQVNFLGLIDTQNEFAYLEAHLYDSHVVGFPLTGSLALVVGWGDNGMFAISVGGFHPDFRDYPTVPALPGAFRDMARVGFALLKGDNPTLTVECYFAVTSNSLQFGAKLELLAKGPMGFNLYGLLAFDALFIFDPFSFSIRLEATLAIRKNTKILFGISFRGQLSGTNPWHVEGEVTFGLLFFDVTIGFSETWGDTLEAIPLETVDLVGVVRSELRDHRNWRSTVGRGLHHTVSHRALEDLGEDAIVIYPFGELTFSQRRLPLNFPIQQFGGQRPLGADRIAVDEVRLSDAVQGVDAAKELFAAGQFTKLSEQEKLSRNSFERFDSGFTLKDSGKLLTAAPDLGPVELDYELNYTDDDHPAPVFTGLAAQAFVQMRRKAAVSRSELGWGASVAAALNGVEAVTVAADGFSIARTSDLREPDGAKRAATLAEAKAMLDAMVANDPELEGELQVVHSYELAG